MTLAPFYHLPYVLQEAETGLYLATHEDGKLMLRRDPRTALRFDTAAAATEYGSRIDAPVELVRVAA